MKGRPIALFILLFISCSFSFNISAWLLPDENASSVSYENFTQNNINYSIVKINGSEVLLLKSSVPVEDGSTIENVLKVYYKSKYYPTQDELDKVLQLLEAYNASRNDEINEEHGCRVALLINGDQTFEGEVVQCIDNRTCEITAKLIYKRDHEFSDWNDWTEVLEFLVPFSFASYGTEAILDNSFQKMSSINEDNIYDNLNYIKTSIPDLKKYKSDLDESVIRIPNSGESCPRCIGYCRLNFNGTALNSLETTLNALVAKVEPFANYKNTSAAIAASTKERKELMLAKNKAEYYRSVFRPLEEEAASLIENGKDMLGRVSNNSLRIKIEMLEELTAEINNSINERNFTTIEENLKECVGLINVTKKVLESTSNNYNNFVQAKRNVKALLTLAGSKELDGESLDKLEELRNRSNSLDAALVPGIPADDFNKLTLAYINLSYDLKAFLKEQREAPLSSAMNILKSAARRVDKQLVSIVKAANLMKPEKIQANKDMVIGGFSVLTFISLTSVVLFVGAISIARYGSRKRFEMLLRVIILFIAIGIVFILSIFLSFLMSKAANTTDGEVWLNDFIMSGKNASIVLELQNVSNASANSMRSCAFILSTSLNQSNISATVYQLNKGCIVGLDGAVKKMTRDECLAATKGEQVFIFNYSDTNGIFFPTIFDEAVSVSGNASWFDECTIASLFGG